MKMKPEKIEENIRYIVSKLEKNGSFIWTTYLENETMGYNENGELRGSEIKEYIPPLLNKVRVDTIYGPLHLIEENPQDVIVNIIKWIDLQEVKNKKKKIMTKKIFN